MLTGCTRLAVCGFCRRFCSRCRSTAFVRRGFYAIARPPTVGAVQEHAAWQGPAHVASAPVS